MDSDSNGAQDSANPRPHWRRRDPSATAVYVVHPTQFRSVVQQLTGAPPAGAQRDPAAAAAPAGANAAAKAGQLMKNDSSSNGRTLGQMHQECMAWAASADD